MLAKICAHDVRISCLFNHSGTLVNNVFFYILLDKKGQFLSYLEPIYPRPWRSLTGFIFDACPVRFSTLIVYAFGQLL
jgi:hypothetical protein